jgi:hypothetical protein
VTELRLSGRTTSLGYVLPQPVVGIPSTSIEFLGDTSSFFPCRR